MHNAALMSVTIALLALMMGSILGMLGGGGSTLALPIFVYIAGLTPGDAIASSLVVVGSTAAVSALMRARKGHVHWKTGLSFGAVAMLGAYGGGRLSGYFPGWLLLSLFAALMVTTALLMMRGRKAFTDTNPRAQKLWLIAIQGFSVGALTGLVGAGGGFMVVPALVLFGGLPMHHAIGTSLLVITMNSGSAVAGHLSHAHVPWPLVLSVTAIAIAGSFIGALLANRMPAEQLRKVFAWFVLVMGLLILSKELAPLIGIVASVSLGATLFILAIASQFRRLLAQKVASNVQAN